MEGLWQKAGTTPTQVMQVLVITTVEDLVQQAQTGNAAQPLAHSALHVCVFKYNTRPDQCCRMFMDVPLHSDVKCATSITVVALTTRVEVMEGVGQKTAPSAKRAGITRKGGLHLSIHRPRRLAVDHLSAIQ